MNTVGASPFFTPALCRGCIYGEHGWGWWWGLLPHNRFMAHLQGALKI